MVLFTRYVKKMKGAAHKNGDVDETSKRDLTGWDGLSEATLTVIISYV